MLPPRNLRTKMFKVLATCLLISAASVAGAQSVFAVDTGATVLTWTGKKVMGQHQGHIHVQHGSVLWRATGLHGCEVVIDMNSITIIGMDPEGETQLGNHLRSADFFNVRKFRTASFKATHIAKNSSTVAGGPNYSVTGDLTIKGITQPVTFPVRAWQEKNGVRAQGTMVFDRTLYGIKYRSGSFFDALGDKVINDQVEIAFDLLAR